MARFTCFTCFSTFPFRACEESPYLRNKLGTEITEITEITCFPGKLESAETSETSETGCSSPLNFGRGDGPTDSWKEGTMYHTGHHGDGEHPPLDTAAQLQPRTRTCPTCSGLLLVDREDPLAFKCSECGRNPEPPAVPPVYTPEGQPLPGSTSARALGRPGIPEGAINGITSRFR